jgi:acetyltransferase-like isoleucine patch superfamily enzyme
MTIKNLLSAALNVAKMCAKNPVTVHLQFLYNLVANHCRFRDYYQGYMARVTGCECEPEVTIYDEAEVSSSQIGSFTYVARGSRVHRTKVGRFCSIGPDCRIGLGTHAVRDYVSTSPVFFSGGEQAGRTFADTDYFRETMPIVIGNDVWIGAGVIILDGVVIGDGAIVAAGAVVAANVSPYAIVGGIPAKLIRYRFDLEVIDRLIATRWWERDEKWLRRHFRCFQSADSLLRLCDSESHAEDAAEKGEAAWVSIRTGKKASR